jgi:HAD superfamily hydrolase (TIGR01509 family)
MPGAYSSKRNFLFDLDGTLVDSSAAHARAYVEALRSGHPKLAEKFDYARVAGQPTRQVLAGLGLSEPELSMLTGTKQACFRAALARGEVNLFPGAMVLLEKLRERKRRLFLVTGASRISALRMLESTKMAGFFEAIFTGDDATLGKPSPEPYLRIIGDHQLEEVECLAIEDGESGVKSAQAAGIDVILIHSAPGTADVPRARDCAQLAEMLL